MSSPIFNPMKEERRREGHTEAKVGRWEIGEPFSRPKVTVSKGAFKKVYSHLKSGTTSIP